MRQHAALGRGGWHGCVIRTWCTGRSGRRLRWRRLGFAGERGMAWPQAQLPPVSSYVGYSVEEPWGQPRVVFGIEAGEAERLAAILDDYTGLAPVGLTRAPERRTAERPARDIAPPAWTVPSATPGGSAQAFEPAQSSGPGRLDCPAPAAPGDPAAPPRSPAEWPDGQEVRPGSSHDQPGAVVFRSRTSG